MVRTSGVTVAIQVALLRGINVGGRVQIPMAELRHLFTSLGFADVRTLLQSGNVVFRSRRTPQQLEAALASEVAKHFRLAVDVFVRTATEWEDIVERNPFPKEAARDPSHLLVMLLRTAPKNNDLDALRAAISGPEVVRADGRQAYIFYPAGIGRSRLTSALVERKLGSRGTARNWNTVLKLSVLAGAARSG